ncbi:hypothetical protein JCM4914_17080 [Streptomyces platensis subsp. malvinus]
MVPWEVLAGRTDGAALDSIAVDLVTGFGPVVAAGWAYTSAGAEPPPGRVRTMVRITAATTAAATMATRGAERHQGPPPPVPPPQPPPPPPRPRPPGGLGPSGPLGCGWGRQPPEPTCVGSGEGPDGRPESGPVGGPVGWLSGGGEDVTGPSSGTGPSGHAEVVLFVPDVVLFVPLIGNCLHQVGVVRKRGGRAHGRPGAGGGLPTVAGGFD